MIESSFLSSDEELREEIKNSPRFGRINNLTEETKMNNTIE